MNPQVLCTSLQINLNSVINKLGTFESNEALYDKVKKWGCIKELHDTERLRYTKPPIHRNTYTMQYETCNNDNETTQ